ncbi:Smr/MutS family protein [Nocardiopsis halophila]|uniref:Smr/MutS family protein n=1 Tax=Nocardiopsis halophila TaxID=141692 RepID=UPI0009FD723F
MNGIEEALRTRAKTVEIIPGTGSGQPKKRVLRYLDQTEVEDRGHRVGKGGMNFGRLFAHFKY